MQQIRQAVEEEVRALAEYVNNSNETALKEVKRQHLLVADETKLEYKSRATKERRERWKSKPLHGQYIRDIEGKVDSVKTWDWLSAGELKKETEGLIMAAQDQALRTNAIKAKIDKTTADSKCRLCKEKEETVDHLISACSKIAQTDYKDRHNKVAAMIHWNLCKNYELPVKQNWWEHKPERVAEKDGTKILWDFKIQTDKHLEHNTPDIVVVTDKQVHIIDVAIPGDSRVDQKEIEKITRYKDLQIEIQRLWKKKATVVPVVIGALGAIPVGLSKHLATIGVNRISQGQLQKAALLGTAHILRRYL